MGQLLTGLVDRMIARTDFKNDAVEAAVEATLGVGLTYATAGIEFEAAAADLGIDPIEASKAVIGLAEQFGESFPAPSAERRTRIKELVNSLISGGDAALESLLEKLFSAAFDFEVSINDLNAEIDAETVVPDPGV